MTSFTGNIGMQTVVAQSDAWLDDNNEPNSKYHWVNTSQHIWWLSILICEKRKHNWKQPNWKHKKESVKPYFVPSLTAMFELTQV